MMTKPRALAITAIVIAATVGGHAAILAAQAPQTRIGAGHSPIWTEIKWPFPVDLWGPGLAFRCSAADCGSEVRLYLRAKLGFCNCTSSIDDEMVDRVGDVNLFASQRAAIGPGRAINVRSMNGRSRGYMVGGHSATAKSALSIAFHDRCDLVVATAAIEGSQPGVQEAPVLQFLNSDLILRWTEVTLGL
jgi:hypothetical protein